MARETACNIYQFTHPCDGEHGKTLEEIKDWCTNWAKYWLFQQEESESGYKHWQGIISLKKRLRPSAAAATIRKYGWCPANISVQHTPDDEELPSSVEDFRRSYASKAQTRIAGPWDSDQPTVNPLPECYDIGNNLNDLQKVILKTWQSLKLRDILFVYGEVGCCGKSSLAQWMARTMPNIILVPTTMESADKMVQWVCDLIPESHQNEDWTVILDIPRGIRGEESWRKWLTTIEMISGGWCADGRNHARQRFTRPIKAICFSNEEPNGNFATWDRYMLINCDDFVGKIPQYRINRKRKYNVLTEEFEYV